MDTSYRVIDKIVIKFMKNEHKLNEVNKKKGEGPLNVEFQLRILKRNKTPNTS